MKFERDEYGYITVHIGEEIMNGLEILRQKRNVMVRNCVSEAQIIESAVHGFLIDEGVELFYQGSTEPITAEECTTEQLTEMMELGWDLFIADGKILGWTKRKE